MKKTIIIFLTSSLLSVVAVAYGWAFVGGQVGEAALAEETVTGSRDAADGLTVGFRADSADNLHWINSYDYSSGETESSFKKGDMARTYDTLVYDDIRFTGWSAVPFSTLLAYDGLEGLQEKKIHAFYDEIQQNVMERGSESVPESVPKAEGKIRLKDYLDYYPVSFRFQFGTKIFNSDNALTGLKVYDEMNMLYPEKSAVYDDEIDLYAAFNSLFKIPVIDNEYQEYKVSGLDDYDCKTSLGYKTEIQKPLGEGEDFYEFDPIIAVQEENIMDGKKWFHPDLSGGLSYEKGGDSDTSYVGKKASDYNLKNRMLFIVNNRTAKGAAADVSHISGGYGVYELPIETTATATVRKGRRSSTLPSPKPLSSRLSMVYPLDENAEYVEMSLSGDHRYLAVFSVKDGAYFVEIVDADNWTSNGPVEVFPASEKMTYAWGDDESLAITNHQGYIALFSRTEDKNEPYEVIYSGRVPDDFDEAFFDTEMVSKENSYAQYRYCIDRGLAVASEDGKVALVQNLLVSSSGADMRNAALECAVIDKTGVIYRGRIKSSIVDLDYDMSYDEIQAVKDLSGGAAVSQVIEPVRNENRCEW